MINLSEAELMTWAIVEAERKLKAKREAEARALAAAPTELKRTLTRFFIALSDYGESVELQRTDRGSLLHFVDTRPLAAAAVALAAAVKKDIPEFRVPELLHLEAALQKHHGKQGRGQDLDPALRQRLEDAIALGKELHLLPDSRPQSEPLPGADLTQLIGWAEILKAIGYDAKDRAGRERVKKLNASTNGPIRRRGKRGVIVNRGALLHWWRTVADRADSAAMNRKRADRDYKATQDMLKNAGERRDKGFHDKERPNTRRRR